MKKFNNMGFTTRGPLIAAKQGSDWLVLNQTFACWGLASGQGCSTGIGVTLRIDETTWSCNLMTKLYNKQLDMGSFGLSDSAPIAQCVTSKDDSDDKYQAIKTTGPMRLQYGNAYPTTSVQTLESFLHLIEKDDVGSIMAQLLWSVRLVSADPDGMVHNDIEPANILVNGQRAEKLRTSLLNPFYMETCVEHKSSFVVPAHRAFAPPERFMAEKTRKNGTLSRSLGPCSATDLWSVGVTLLQIITRGSFLPAIQSDMVKHPIDASDIQAYKVTQWLIDFGKAPNKMMKMKQLQKQWKANQDGKYPQWTEKMKSDMDFMKKIALGQDNDLSDLISGLLNEDPEARMTIEQALTNPFIDKAVKKLKP